MSSLDTRLELLAPDNCTVAFVDHQPLMVFGIGSIDGQTLKNNTIALAKAARAFEVPVVLTSINPAYSGDLWPELSAAAPDAEPIERTTMNPWEDEAFVAAVTATGRRKLVLAGLWTEVCVCYPALDALADGYDVYVVTDACGGTTKEAHEMAVERMIQAGVVPVTWQQVLLEFQRDWAREETYAATLDVVKEHSGAYGTGIEYVQTVVAGDASSEAPASRKPPA
ncbi:hydrolase [Halomarina pelagica]|uniref:hydrolase n=1 Tax=Halomarina pelagica TaxID=2961599 RepID=UPI0020C531D0|nr:hydrolase [Halomarina sp. BND7]